MSGETKEYSELARLTQSGQNWHTVAQSWPIISFDLQKAKQSSKR